MKLIPVRTGFISLLIFQAVIISLVTMAFMVNLYNIYTDLVYAESAEVLSLYTDIAETRLSQIEDISFEVLSDSDIHKNISDYIGLPGTIEAHLAVNSLYSQLFAKQAMNSDIASINFVFPDHKCINVGQRYVNNLSEKNLDAIIEAAYNLDGACGWAVNSAGNNTLTLYRLIRDISGFGFKPQGVLIINADADILFDKALTASRKYKPEIVCMAGEHILSREPVSVDTEKLTDFPSGKNTYNIVSQNRKQYIVSVKNLKLTGWRFAYILSSEEILGSIYNVNITYIIVLLIITVAVITIAYVLADSISKPIARLTRTMKVVENGDYTVIPNERALVRRIAIAEVLQLSTRFYQMVQKIDNMINEGFVKRLNTMEMKYKMLQRQINTNFLYDTLDAINRKAVQGGNKDISIMARSISKILRGSASVPDMITVREDMEFVSNYIAIQKVRFEERLSLKVNIAPEAYNCKIPKLTLQQIVENCFVNNVEKHSGAYKITMDSSVSDDILKLAIEDGGSVKQLMKNGQGTDVKRVEKALSRETDDPSAGVGLIRQRLKLSFGEEYDVIVENGESAGTRVTVTLPYTVRTNEDVM